MKNWLIGTGMVISGGILIMLLEVMGLSRQAAVSIGVAVSVGGFVVQVYTAFSMKSSFERQHKLAQQEHRALMKRAQELPPEQAIQLLLGRIDGFKS